MNRYDPPRNRSTYSHDITRKFVANRFDALNRAEYYIWSAIRTSLLADVLRLAEVEADKARARFWLGIFQTWPRAIDRRAAGGAR